MIDEMKYSDVIVTKGQRMDWKATENNIYKWLRTHPDPDSNTINSMVADALSAAEMTRRLKALAKRAGGTMALVHYIRQRGL